MTDVEELLRETLSDGRRRLEPPPGLFERVHDQARARKHRRTTIASASVAVVVLAIAGSIAGAQQSSSKHRVQPGSVSTPTPTPSPSSSPTPTATGTTPVDTGTVGRALGLGLMPGTAIQTAMTTDAVYVLATNPSRVIAVSPTDGLVKKTVAGPAGNPTGISVGDGLVLAWSQDTGSLRAYDPQTLTLLRHVETGLQIFNAIAIDGRIYLTTNDGLMRVSDHPAGTAVNASPTTPVADIASAYALAADPSRHRILVDNAGHIDAIDTRTYAVTEGENLNYNKTSIAVVGDTVWAAGYVSGDSPRLVRLDPVTLQVVAHGDPQFDLGPGAQIWAGQHVLWVSGGMSSVSCVDPTKGTVLEQWGVSVAGPIGSVGGSAYGINTATGVLPLNLGNGCTG
jgi:hypothetical protein